MKRTDVNTKHSTPGGTRGTLWTSERRRLSLYICSCFSFKMAIIVRLEICHETMIHAFFSSFFRGIEKQSSSSVINKALNTKRWKDVYIFAFIEYILDEIWNIWEWKFEMSKVMEIFLTIRKLCWETFMQMILCYCTLCDYDNCGVSKYWVVLFEYAIH